MEEKFGMKAWHVGVIVKDLDEAEKFYFAFPGCDKDSWVREHIVFPDDVCPVGGGIDVNIARGNVGDMCYELIQPNKKGIYQDKALQARGEVVHHVAYFVGDNHDEIVDSLLAAGGKIEWAVRAPHETLGTFKISFVAAPHGSMIFEIIGDRPF